MKVLITIQHCMPCPLPTPAAGTEATNVDEAKKHKQIRFARLIVATYERNDRSNVWLLLVACHHAHATLLAVAVSETGGERSGPSLPQWRPPSWWAARPFSVAGPQRHHSTPAGVPIFGNIGK